VSFIPLYSNVAIPEGVSLFIEEATVATDRPKLAILSSKRGTAIFSLELAQNGIRVSTRGSVCGLGRRHFIYPGQLIVFDTKLAKAVYTNADALSDVDKRVDPLRDPEPLGLREGAAATRERVDFRGRIAFHPVEIVEFTTMSK
jgi:hypothetical protein